MRAEQPQSSPEFMRPVTEKSEATAEIRDAFTPRDHNGNNKHNNQLRHLGYLPLDACHALSLRITVTPLGRRLTRPRSATAGVQREGCSGVLYRLGAASTTHGRG